MRRSGKAYPPAAAFARSCAFFFGFAALVVVGDQRGRGVGRAAGAIAFATLLIAGYLVVPAAVVFGLVD